MAIFATSPSHKRHSSAAQHAPQPAPPAPSPPPPAKKSIPLHRRGDVIDDGAYTIVELVGTGAFGAVYRAVDRSRRTYAIKVLYVEDEPTPAPPPEKGAKGRPPPKRSALRRYAEEVSMHAAVSAHPGVLTLHRTFVAGDRAYLVLDYCGGGTLLGAITERGLFWFDDEAITRAFLQLCDAVAHCHRWGMAHRDLKPDNILVSSCGSRFYLADFGLATTDRNCEQFGAGSKHYKSPECIGTEVVAKTYNTHAADVFSLGIVLVNMITGGYPWTRATTGDSNFAAFVRDPRHLGAVLPLSKPAAALLARVLTPDPSRRISLPELRREASVIGRWGLDDAELAFASETARANVHSYARTLRLDYALPPPARPAPPPRPARPHIDTARARAHAERSTTDSAPTPASSSVCTPPASACAGAEPASPTGGRFKHRSSTLIRNFRRMRIWGAPKHELDAPLYSP